MSRMKRWVALSCLVIAFTACGSGEGDGVGYVDPSYTVTYNGNGNTGGSVPVDSTRYLQGQTVSVLGNGGNLEKTGYFFDGWSTEPDQGTVYSPGQTFAIGQADIVLFARWTVSPLAAPTGLTATGSLGEIDLSWNAVTDQGLTGYKVYRSVDGVTFTERAAVEAVVTAYTDIVESPAGDGVSYYYQVTALRDIAESDFSSSVKSMHGTRLAAGYSGGFTTQEADSPYVAESTTVVDGGNFIVASNTKLYVLDNSIIDLESGRDFGVSGLLRTVVTSGAVHATFTAHKPGGLADGEGFNFWVSNAVNYNPDDDSGSLLRHVQISNLSSSGASINFSGIKLDNVKISANVSNGNSYFDLTNDGWAVIRNCSFEKNLIRIGTDLRATAFTMKQNVFRGSNISIYFMNLANPGVNPGQIEQNDFDGSQSAWLYNMTGGSNVPLGNNYWNGGTGSPPVPAVAKIGTASIDINFNDPSAPLSSSPAWAGPDW